jgi:hypothetical protein
VTLVSSGERPAGGHRQADRASNPPRSFARARYQDKIRECVAAALAPEPLRLVHQHLADQLSVLTESLPAQGARRSRGVLHEDRSRAGPQALPAITSRGMWQSRQLAASWPRPAVMWAELVFDMPVESLCRSFMRTAAQFRGTISLQDGIKLRARIATSPATVPPKCMSPMKRVVRCINNFPAVVANIVF